MAEDGDQWEKVKGILADAVELPSAKRKEFVTNASDGDTDLESAVHKLLNAHEDVSGFLEEPISAQSGLFERLPSLEPGAVLGPYTIEETLGEGGFGIVYKAKQSEPVRREVALKVIKPGMDSQQIISRFAHERQALERMDHPNIARVLDAGATEDNRPFFVMELVAGEPISKYCARMDLPVEDRVRLMTQVCAAVQHAHQKSVIHRDLKPSNVLVESQTGKPIVKVIDFGIAKAVDPSQVDPTLFTRQGQMVGTPSYMSPEQAAGHVDIDTRTDVYSLGVLLYELATGVCPFPSRMLSDAGLTEMQRIIQEVDPPKPSTRILSETKGDRTQDSILLSRKLKGDLDWIAMKALEKDRDRRYDSPAALAEDLERHLRDEPVLAGPPTAAYRFAKFARRNRGALVAGVLVLGAMLGGLGLAIYGLNKAQEERDLAETAREKEKDAREDAQAALAQAQVDRDLARTAQENEALEREKALEALQKANAARSESDGAMTFLSQMLSSARPADQGKDVLVVDLLDITAPTLEQVDNTSVEARLRYAIGATYNALGEFDKAELHLTRGLEVRKLLSGNDHIDTLTVANEVIANRIGKGDFSGGYDQAKSTYEMGLKKHGLEEWQTLASLQHMAYCALDLGRYEEALSHYKTAVEAMELHPDNIQGRGAILTNMGLTYATMGRHAEALEIYNKVLASFTETWGPEHMNTMAISANLVSLNFRMGNYDDAENHAKDILAWRVEELGAIHPDSMESLNNLSVIYMMQGKFEEALPIARENVALRREINGDDHYAVAVALSNLGQTLGYVDKHEEAVEVMREAVRIDRKTRGVDHPSFYLTVNSLASSIIKAHGLTQEAQDLMMEAVEGSQRLQGPTHQDTLNYARDLAYKLIEVDRDEEAIQFLQDRLATAELEATHPSGMAYRRAIGTSQKKLGRVDEALVTLKAVLTDIQASKDPAQAGLARVHEEVGLCLREIPGSNPSEVEEHLLASWQLYCETHGPKGFPALRLATHLVAHYKSEGSAKEIAIWEEHAKQPEELEEGKGEAKESSSD